MGLSYKDTGVDLQRGDRIKHSIKSQVKSTHTKNVLGDIGLFSGLFALDVKAYSAPVLVSSIDGVGTKVKIAEMMGRYDSIGEDLVNHCVNDIMVCGADPLFFMDYIASDKLEPNVIEEIVAGLASACRECGCALIGGETAEMPGVYAPGNFDVAGAIVGVVEKDRIIDGSRIRPGDLLVGIPSNGLHTNGFSLVRKVFIENDNTPLNSRIAGLNGTLGEELLQVHRSYAGLIKNLRGLDGLHGIAHITGGGIKGNASRLVSDAISLTIDWGAWQWPAIFRIIQEVGGVPDDEMKNVFNLGMGLVLIIKKSCEREILTICHAFDAGCKVLGSVK